MPRKREEEKKSEIEIAFFFNERLLQFYRTYRSIFFNVYLKN